MVNRANQSRGAWGERRAATEYERDGYRVVDHNWRGTGGELDLILRRPAARGDLYVFSEVKTRRSDRYGPPGAAVSTAKQQRIRRLALEWLRAHDLHASAIRFDVVAITGVRIEIIESAF